MLNHSNLSIDIRNIKMVNPQFSSCDVYVMSKEVEANGTYFSEEVIIKALPSIIGVPIVAEYSDEIEDFKGHGGRFDGDTLEFKHTTQPYGFVPESTDIEWVTNLRGEKYIVLRNCVLWTGRYKEANLVIEEGKSQSMEIEIKEGHWNDDLDCYEIDDFIFSALCILGDYTTPAFSGAKIIKGSINFENESFKMEFAKMIEEVQVGFKGVDKMEDIKVEETVETVETEVEVYAEETVEEVVEAIDEIIETVEELKETVEELVETEELEKETEEKDFEETVETTEDVIKETVETVELEIDNNKHDYAELLSSLENLKTHNESLEKELAELREYKLETERIKHETLANEIFEKFELTNDDVKDLEVSKYTLEEIEEKCYAIIGKKLASRSKFSLEPKGLKLNINSSQKSDDVYGDIFNKYKK